MLFKPFVAFSAVFRYIEVRAEDESGFPAETKTAWVSPSTLSQRYSGGGSRSASASIDSRKRSRSQISAPAPGDEEEEEGRCHERNVRAKLSSDADEEEAVAARWYALNVDGATASESDDEGSWYQTNVVGEEAGDGRPRGRPRERQLRRARSAHTVDTLPLLTDTASVDDFEHSFHAAPP